MFESGGPYKIKTFFSSEVGNMIIRQPLQQPEKNNGYTNSSFFNFY